MILGARRHMRRMIHHCPDNQARSTIANALQVGDVILFAERRELCPIYTYQRRLTGFSEISKLFIHVAIFIGHNQIVHSTPDTSLDGQQCGGVKREFLDDCLVSNNLFVFLRSPIVLTSHWDAIAQCAMTQVGIPYNYVGCVRAAVMAFGGRSIAHLIRVGRIFPTTRKYKDAVDAGRSLVCSDFVYSVFDEVFNHKNPCNLPGGRQHGISTPCEYFDNHNFDCITV